MSEVLSEMKRDGTDIILAERMVENLTFKLTNLQQAITGALDDLMNLQTETTALAATVQALQENQSQGQTYSVATTSANGLMSSSDKTKLNGIETGAQKNVGVEYTQSEKNKLSGIDDNANNYTHPTGAGYEHVPSGGSANQILSWESDGKAQWNNTGAYYLSSADANSLSDLRGVIYVNSLSNCPDWNGSAYTSDTRGAIVFNVGMGHIYVFPHRSSYIFLKKYGSSSWTKLTFA